ADPSAHVWSDGKLYIYASHDMFPSRGCDLMDKYHVFSTDNMVTWKDEGEILSSADVSWGRPEGGFMWAPDAAYKNGTYYFYFPHPTGSGDLWNSTWRIGVATSNSPAGGFTCANDGYIKKVDGSPYITNIDPCVFKDDDGTFYLYTGGGANCYVAKLADNMTQLAENPVKIDGTLTDFHEAMWVFKRNGIYYAMYADNTNGENLMRYSTASSPYGPWKYGGIVLEGTGCDTTHGSIAEYKGHWYLFYHNCEISGNGTLRNVCIDEVNFNSDGSIQTVAQTKQGVLAVDKVNPADLQSNNGNPDPSAFTIKTDYSVNTAIIGGEATLGNNVVENLHMEGSYVQWNNIDGGEKGGKAMLTVYYGTPDGATSLVHSSGDKTGDGYFLKYEKTTGWSDYSGVARCFIDLNAGNSNTVQLICGMGGVNITGISVSLSDSLPDNPPEEITTLPEQTTSNTGSSLCDLVVTDIITDKLYNVTDEALLGVKIKNIGNVASPSGVKHGIAISADGQVVNWCDNFLGSVNPGEEKIVYMNWGPNLKNTWTVTAGSHRFTAHVNDTRDVEELNTDNNIFEKEMSFNNASIVVSSDVVIHGIQMSLTAEGIRTLYSVENQINGQNVIGRGLIYSLADYTSEDEMYVGSSNRYVEKYEGTTAFGQLPSNLTSSPTSSSFAMTMVFDDNSTGLFTKKIAVRAYAQLKDGSYVYGNVVRFTFFNIAKTLYDNNMMSNFAGHNYLYEKVLKIVDPDYKEVLFNWNNILAPAN
ncbi:MAG: family 43 glycosylhydrolase, partial [Lachnospiraceae bacterium]|nr:family 43 glycosylhydrolase [Lachnospiraceae bacterium]